MGAQFTPREMEVWDYVIVRNRAKISAGTTSIDWAKAALLWAKTVKVATLQDANKQPQMRHSVYTRDMAQLREKKKTLDKKNKPCPEKR